MLIVDEELQKTTEELQQALRRRMAKEPVVDVFPI